MLTINLNRISQISAQGKRVQNLAHLINAVNLMQAHAVMDEKKATGIDKVSKAEYGEHLEDNVAKLEVLIPHSQADEPT